MSNNRDKFCVAVNKDIFHIIQKLGKLYGYNWPTPNPKYDYPWLPHHNFVHFNRKDSCFFTSNSINEDYKEIKLSELTNYLENKIEINGNIVEFTTDGIKVGCTTVSKEIIKEIASHFN